MFVSMFQGEVCIINIYLGEKNEHFKCIETPNLIFVKFCRTWVEHGIFSCTMGALRKVFFTYWRFYMRNGLTEWFRWTKLIFGTSWMSFQIVYKHLYVHCPSWWDFCILYNNVSADSFFWQRQQNTLQNCRQYKNIMTMDNVWKMFIIYLAFNAISVDQTFEISEN